MDYPPELNLKKILVTRTDRIGDMVLSTPVFSEIKKAFPEAEVTALCQPVTAPILRGNPNIDEIIVYDKRGAHRSFIKTILFAMQLRKQKFDCVVCLHPTNRVHIISFFAGIPLRVGYDKKMSFLLNKKISDKKYEGLKHESEYNFDLLEQIGIKKPEELRLYFDPCDEGRDELSCLLTEVSLRQNFVAMFTGSSCNSKIWPEEYFSDLADKVAEKYDCSIVLVGGAEDKARAERIKSMTKCECIDFSGRLSLKGLGSLFEKANLLISNDSGPAHIAAALDTPVISIFGRKNAGLSPKRWRPLGDKSWFLHKDVGCVSCLAHACQIDFKCLKSITPEDVLGIIEAHRDVFGF